MNTEDIIQKIFGMFGQVPDNYCVLEEQMDVGVQMEYFEFTRGLRNGLDTNAVLSNREKLLEAEYPIPEKRLLLAQLSLIEDVVAYRAIENYSKNVDVELKQWALLALHESRMLLEATFLDENQVFISTGLGGKKSKLRYFAVITSKTGEIFTEFQQKIIGKEFQFALQQHDAELEELNFSDNFATMIAVIPLSVQLDSIFKSAIDECNQFGKFLKNNAIITNVKILSNQEIRDFLEQQDLVSIRKEDDE